MARILPSTENGIEALERRQLEPAADQFLERPGQLGMPGHARREPLDGVRRAHEQRPTPVPQRWLALAALRWLGLEPLEAQPPPISPGQHRATGFTDDERSGRHIPDAR